MSPSSPHSPCEQPFDQGGKLCSHCSKLPGTPLGKNCSRLVSESAPMQALLRKALTVAATDAAVVLRGESGAGKEVIARAVHANSARRAKPFIALNCAALTPQLLESELFGHAKGAFTGATSARRGLFEAAHGGTLFLDEIVELPLELQPKLLRALQDGEIRRVGENHAFSVDVRVLCATHRNLTEALEEGRLRQDLYFRLKVFTLAVPPLRERREDIPRLAEIFLQQQAHRTARFTGRALAAFESYSWPGNVRELRHAVLHGAVLSGGSDVDLEHLPEELSQGQAKVAPGGASASLLTLAELERGHILRVLQQCGGHQTEAARVLGIGRTTLWRKLKEHKLAG